MIEKSSVLFHCHWGKTEDLASLRKPKKNCGSASTRWKAYQCGAAQRKD